MTPEFQQLTDRIALIAVVYYVCLVTYFIASLVALVKLFEIAKTLARIQIDVEIALDRNISTPQAHNALPNEDGLRPRPRGE
jgi:hypothetical protein